MANHALDSNPPNADFHLTTHGSDWLWAVFSVFVLSLLVMVFTSFRRQRGTRLFHQIAIIILATGSIAYFCMASDLGATPINAEFRGPGTRQIWYVRYIQWFINFPLVLLMMLLVTGLPLSDILTTLFMAIVVVVTGLVGALVQSTYKWGLYVFGVMALFYIWHVLLWHAHRPSPAFSAGNALRSGYLMGAGYFSFMLITYPVAWACSEGGNVISVTSEMIWYGILDILAGPVFLFVFLWKLRGIDYALLGLQSGKWTEHNAAMMERGAPVSAPMTRTTAPIADATAPSPSPASAYSGPTTAAPAATSATSGPMVVNGASHAPETTAPETTALETSGAPAVNTSAVAP